MEQYREVQQPSNIDWAIAAAIGNRRRNRAFVYFGISVEILIPMANLEEVAFSNRG